MPLRHGSMQLSYSSNIERIFSLKRGQTLQNKLNTLEQTFSSMDTEPEVQERIKEWTKHCIAFIEAGGKGEVGKMISSANRKIIEAKVGECCPTCDTIMEPTTKRGRQPKKGESPDPRSITVEHVVSRTLGGNNKLDNLVAMCHQCNMYRNATMTKLIPSYAKMHGRQLTDDERDKVGRFIEWSIRTIRTPSTKIDPECSELFAAFIAKSKSKTTAGKKQSYDGVKNPVSNRSDMKQMLEVLQEIRDTQKAILELMLRPKKNRLRSWFKGVFGKKKGSHPAKVSIPKSPEKSKKPVKKKSKKKSPSTQIQTEQVLVIPEDFEQTIRNVLEGREPMKLAVFGHELKKYQEKNQWDHTGTEAFLVMHGFHKKYGLKKAILSKMPNEVMIEGVAPRQTISLKMKEEIPVHEETVQEAIPQEAALQDQPEEPLIELNLQSFQAACIAVINEPMSPATFALRLGAHASVVCSSEISAKEFAHQCGIAKSWSLLKSLRTHVSDRVVVDGIGTAATIAPIDSA